LLNSLKKKIRIDELSGLQLFQLVRYGSLLLISIVLAKSGLDLESFGRYELIIFIAGAVSFFWLTGIIQSLLPLYKNSDAFGKTTKDKGGPELFNAFFLLLVFALAGALLIILVAYSMPGVVEERLSMGLVPFLAAFVVFQAPSSLAEYIYVLRKKGTRAVLYGLIAFGVQILAVSIPAIMGLELRWILTGLVGSALLRFIWVIILLAGTSRLSLSRAFIKEHLHLGLPIMLSVLLSGSASYIDGFIVTGYFDEDVFAVFRNGARELPLVALLAHALSSALVPKFNEMEPGSALAMIKERSLPLIKILFPFSLVLVIASYYLFPIFYDDRFYDSAGVFNLYLLLVITRLVFPQTILIGLKRTRILVLASALELVLNIALSLVLVRVWGIRGVALATVIAYAFERGFLISWIKIKLKIDPGQYIHTGKHLAWSAAIIAVYVLVELLLGSG